ncbi:MAG: SAM-dependent methyltransferase [Clostridia bacterium]|jgi:23S rRNA (cytidine2498-2'-O)-methyltransferase|nr:SAM-dependent methyltransferase [Clostridia bacterium]
MTENFFSITANVNYINQALEEAREVDKALKIVQNYGNGILLSATSMTKEEFNTALVHKKPVFIRHISAFDAIGEINNNMTTQDVANMVMSYISNIEKDSKIAVQIRKARGEYYFNPIDLKGEIDKILVELGAEAEIKEPDYIISILLDEANCYIGMSPSELNLSSWSGGMVHYKKEDADISRAKYKLMEALDTFELNLSDIRSALDLGAAPGGWTSVLLEKKIAVTAVDTGDMDIRLNKYQNYTNIKANASEIELPEQSFDLLTSDVSWNAKNTAVLVNRASKFLRDGGYAIVTVKLMGDKVRRTIREVKEIYQEIFDVMATKQLFHNRDEITLLLRKRK